MGKKAETIYIFGSKIITFLLVDTKTRETGGWRKPQVDTLVILSPKRWMDAEQK